MEIHLDIEITPEEACQILQAAKECGLLHPHQSTLPQTEIEAVRESIKKAIDEQLQRPFDPEFHLGQHQ